ncbi:MAG: PHP domain-containing protein [Candidatus Heimdallarchaeota archaeon]|nr:MAG: PHP domain-containing protein [Candidatus Heimdallarchaeota archaeon]
MRRHDLHTHTNFSDGRFSPEDLVQLAREKKLKILGICDHAFSKKLLDSYQITTRLEEYLRHLETIQKSLNGLMLRIGIEIDVSKNYGVDPALLPVDILNQFDFVLFEYVNTASEYWGKVGRRSHMEVISIRNQLEIPVGLAHNDIQQNYQGKEAEISKILAQNEIFIELQQSERGRNTRNGMDYYNHFSQRLIHSLVENGVRIVCGTDTHTGEFLGELDDVYQFISQNNLQYHELVM